MLMRYFCAHLNADEAEALCVDKGVYIRLSQAPREG